MILNKDQWNAIRLRKKPRSATQMTCSIISVWLIPAILIVLSLSLSCASESARIGLGNLTTAIAWLQFISQLILGTILAGIFAIVVFTATVLKGKDSRPVKDLFLSVLCTTPGILHITLATLISVAAAGCLIYTGWVVVGTLLLANEVISLALVQGMIHAAKLAVKDWPLSELAVKESQNELSPEATMSPFSMN